MKRVIIIIIAIVMQFSATAQKKVVTDSIYYLVDTANVPVKDRMVEVYNMSWGVKCFEILCPCLKYGQNPILRYSLKDKGKFIWASDMKKITLVSVSDLLKKIHSHFEANFNGIQIYQIIEKEGENYRMHRVEFLPQSPPSNPDYIDPAKKP